MSFILHLWHEAENEFGFVCNAHVSTDNGSDYGVCLVLQ